MEVTDYATAAPVTMAAETATHPLHTHACASATCPERTCHSLPVGDVGLVVPVLPALQRVDVCVHPGLATGHRTRHGESREPGAWEGATPRSARRVQQKQEIRDGRCRMGTASL